MPKTKIDTVPGKEIKLTIYRGATTKGAIAFTDMQGDLVDLTGSAVEWNFYQRGEITPEITWTLNDRLAVLSNNLSWEAIEEPEANFYMHEMTITLSDGFVIVNYGDALVKDKVNTNE